MALSIHIKPAVTSFNGMLFLNIITDFEGDVERKSSTCDFVAINAEKHYLIVFCYLIPLAVAVQSPVCLALIRLLAYRRSKYVYSSICM